mmetsp:Transcript_151967/g.487815  ORF Transcript_151967/g.487815 Transcript_151967/m.487815 type:complete len:220 (+) Transcript_151967:808-1467(+)
MIFTKSLISSSIIFRTLPMALSTMGTHFLQYSCTCSVTRPASETSPWASKCSRAAACSICKRSLNCEMGATRTKRSNSSTRTLAFSAFESMLMRCNQYFPACRSQWCSRTSRNVFHSKSCRSRRLTMRRSRGFVCADMETSRQAASSQTATRPNSNSKMVTTPIGVVCNNLKFWILTTRPSMAKRDGCPSHCTRSSRVLASSAAIGEARRRRMAGLLCE